MNPRLLTLFLAAFLLAGAAPPGKLVRAGETISWTMSEGRKIYRLGDLTAVFDRVPCAPPGENCEEGDVEPTLTLSIAGGKTVTLAGSPMQNILMLGPVARGGPVSAFFQSYTGGMHCCQKMQLVTPGGDGLAVVDLGAFDGMEIGWPRDLDGDGNLDFVVTDDRFLYAFDSYAASYPPPQILNVIAGKAVDVSADPRFRAVFVKAAARTRKACETERSGNGACAAWAANAARLGELDSAWPVILTAYEPGLKIWPDACRVARDAEYRCPEGQLIEYPDYPTALRAFLESSGYMPPA